MDDIDRAVLELAVTPYRYPAVRETHATTRFWARVNALLEDPVAEREMAAEVRRLRRLRDLRRRERAGAR